MLSLNGQVMLTKGIQSGKLHTAHTGVAALYVSWSEDLIGKIWVYLLWHAPQQLSQGLSCIQGGEGWLRPVSQAEVHRYLV